MATSYELGLKGEDLARSYLEKNGFEILETHWYHKRNEIDIIAKIDDYIVFVEVKTRSSEQFDTPDDAINRVKQRVIISVANEYIRQNEIDLEARFDIIWIYFRGKTYSIKHIDHAFYPGVSRL